jgi:hypothetical protein
MSNIARTLPDKRDAPRPRFFVSSEPDDEFFPPRCLHDGNLLGLMHIEGSEWLENGRGEGDVGITNSSFRGDITPQCALI